MVKTGGPLFITHVVDRTQSNYISVMILHSEDSWNTGQAHILISGTVSLNELSRVIPILLKVEKSRWGIPTQSWSILEHIYKLARRRRNSERHLPNLSRRTSYDILDKELIRLVNHLCTASILLMLPSAVGDQTGERYSTRGRIYTISVLIKVHGSWPRIQRRIWLDGWIGL